MLMITYDVALMRKYTNTLHSRYGSGRREGQMGVRITENFIRETEALRKWLKDITNGE